MRLFIYEYASAQPASALLPESVRREGRAMFEAVVDDARKLEPEIEVITIPEHSALSTEYYFRQADHALIIAPEFDGILKNLARQALKAGCKLLGPMPEAIRLTADKWELYRHWQSRQVPTPETWLSPQLPTEMGMYVKKHRWGAGSLGIGWWKPGDDLPTDHLVQRYVPGTPVSVALLIGRGGNVTPLWPALQSISDDGRFSYLGGALLTDDNLCQRVRQLAQKAVLNIEGLQGYVGVDGVLGKINNGDEDRVLEINPRLTTSYLGLRQASTTNLMKWMLECPSCDSEVPKSEQAATIKWSV